MSSLAHGAVINAKTLELLDEWVYPKMSHKRDACTSLHIVCVQFYLSACPLLYTPEDLRFNLYFLFLSYFTFINFVQI